MSFIRAVICLILLGSGMEFADFDDDLFEEKPSRGTVAKDYQARMCEAGWFMEVKLDQLVSQEDEFGVKKFTADYLYLNKSFDAAAVKYEEILNGLPESSTTSRRECQENLARCLIKAGTPDKAVAHAEKLHSTSKTLDQLTVSYSTLLDVYLAVSRYYDALRAAQNLISIHPDNGHFWMKLGYMYACVERVMLPNVSRILNAHLPAMGKTSMAPAVESSHLQDDMSNCLENNTQDELHSAQEVSEQERAKREVLVVAACLHRAYYILVKTEGTAVGFAVPNTIFLKEQLLGDLKFLLDDCTLKELRYNVHQNDKMEISSCLSESVDCNQKENSDCRTDDENVEKDVSEEKFAEKWFKWII